MNFQQVGIVAALVAAGLATLIYVRFYLIPRIVLRYKLFKTKKRLAIMMNAATGKATKRKIAKIIGTIDTAIEKLK